MRRIIIQTNKIHKVQESQEVLPNDVVVKCDCSTYHIDAFDYSILEQYKQLICPSCDEQLSIVDKNDLLKANKYLITSWASIFTISLQETLELGGDNWGLKCNTCSSVYQYDGRTKYPKRKWDTEKKDLKVVLNNDPMKYYRTIESYISDYRTCKCGEPFNAMIQLETNIPKGSWKTPYIKVGGDLVLDHSYLDSEDKKKHWSDLPGGLEEHEDIHGNKFDQFHSVKDTL